MNRGLLLGFLACILLIAEFWSSRQTLAEPAAQQESVSQGEAANEIGAEVQKKVDTDIVAFRDYFKRRFPAVEFAELKDGVYVLDKESREQWLEIEDFPPYEFAVDEGKVLFETAFANGKTYADCFDKGGIGIRQNFPYFDTELGEVMTLELAINQCRKANGESPLPYKSDAISSLSAYMAWVSRDQVFDVKVPNQAAFNAYEAGKKFFYSKRGQLNFSCADCHMRISGQKLRADIIGPGLGHPTGFPVYRAKWEDMGTLHRRYEGCNAEVRAKPFAAQSLEYRNLEYFQTIMSNGLAVNGPSSRR